ncbi:MAG: thermonuclease family protein [Planctomycetaceae bacterium]|jgi:micrococcal nuclease|nr:thermonuclease family protein [Planctomycetaceae bacterium]
MSNKHIYIFSAVVFSFSVCFLLSAEENKYRSLVETFTVNPAVTRWGEFEVISVTDGDTIRINNNGVSVPVRFVAVNAPELRPKTQKTPEPLAKEAKAFVEKAIAVSKNRVILYRDGRLQDRYKRELALVCVLDENGQERSLDEMLVQQGLAKVENYPYSKMTKDYLLAVEKDGKGKFQKKRRGTMTMGYHSTLDRLSFRL